MQMPSDAKMKEKIFEIVNENASICIIEVHIWRESQTVLSVEKGEILSK